MGLIECCEICVGFDELVGTSLGFLAAAELDEFVSRDEEMGDDISRFLVPPLNIALTSLIF